jgi:HAD superfamily hydrolase (TIGR01509 family)
MSNICVIFDLDGTLVDSETLGTQAFLDLLPELSDPVEVLVRRYRGIRLSAILADIELRVGKRLPDAFEATYRGHVSELFARDLKPMPGVTAMLDSLSYAKCIASSGPPAKIQQALEVSGLASYFGPRVFSSYDIGFWKPDPGLFLHAAQAMGFAPGQCSVVEDSDVGIQAAIAAGMKAFHYLQSDQQSADQGATPFYEMSELNGHLARARA